MNEVIVSMNNISKSFPGVKALDHVKFELRSGEVMALLGENGAGKSTLMKILSGVYTRDEGTMEIFGKSYDDLTPKQAQEAGVAIIHQELNMCRHLTVTENMFLGREVKGGLSLNNAKMRKEAKRVLDDLRIDISPDQIVGDLPVSKQQMVEIAKALSINARILIMDEPTSSLTAKEIEEADGIIVAADAQVPMDRFDGKKVIECQVSDGISKADALIERAINGDAPVYHAAEGSKAASSGAKSGGGAGHKIYMQLMNGVSHMLPLVVGGGILIAIAFLIDGLSIDLSSLPADQRANFGTITPVAALFKSIGDTAFGFMLPLCCGILIWRERRQRLKRRKRMLAQQFKEAMVILAASLSAGYAVENAMAVSLEELRLLYGEQGLIVREFSGMVQQIRTNRNVEQVLAEFAGRSGLEDVQNLAEVLGIGKRTGGDLGSIMRHTAEVIRDKMQVKEEIITLTTSRQFEQKIMNMIPFFIIVYVEGSSPGFFDQMYCTGMGRVLMTMCLILYLTAFWLSERILDIEV